MQTIESKYPVIIVGGGVNGVGIARDCALRGIPCLLLEKGDFSGGTSGSSSGMIHGGPRYMLGDVSVTKLACLDSGYIQKVAPHLLFRVPFLYSVHKNKNRSTLAAKALLEGVEAFFGAYDQFVPLKNGMPHTRLSAKEVVELESNIPSDGLMGGVTFDEWGIDVPRLCIANAIDAKENGAHVRNHTAVTEVLKDNGVITGVKIQDLLTGDSRTVECELLINATGPWSPKMGEMMGTPIKIRGGKGIHITLDRRLFNMAIVSQCIDGREIFVMPYENTSVIGTTDDDFFGDLDDQRVTDEEVAYLMDGIEQVFPAIRKARVINAWSGVRPTIYERDCYEDALSREHEVLDHEVRDDVKGAISLIGGKLASYRIMAEEVVDLIAKKLGNKTSCTTQSAFLPGGENVPDVKSLASDYQMDPYTVSRLVYRHGNRAVRILDSIKANPELGAMICPCEPVTEAEVRYVVEHEMASTLSDVRRRTRFSLGPCQGTECLLPTASILNELKNDDDVSAINMAQNYWQEWWWNRACVMNGDQLVQEELNQALHYCNNSF